MNLKFKPFKHVTYKFFDRKLQPSHKEVPEHDSFIRFQPRHLFVSRWPKLQRSLRVPIALTYSCICILVTLERPRRKVFPTFAGSGAGFTDSVIEISTEASEPTKGAEASPSSLDSGALSSILAAGEWRGLGSFRPNGLDVLSFVESDESEVPDESDESVDSDELAPAPPTGGTGVTCSFR